ncbi:MAG: glycoside hydrolase family 3 C-terminal domain-containing protein [Arenicella sp.]|nr:glycoside hydrolase family 3 C-terminal domain-containing protein [Arenicella sp.]
MNRDSTNAHTHLEQQVEELLDDLSLREKLGQCVMIEPCFCLEERNSEEFGDDFSSVMDPEYLEMLLVDYNIGSFLFGGASRIGDGSPVAWADYIARVRKFAHNNTRHKIPMLFGIDAVHGLNFMKGSTIYTHNLAVTATWNPQLARQYAAMVGTELSSIGFNCNFAPTIDVARDTRWGRVYESLGEDPYLAAEISRALVEGMQGNGDLAACAKHFIGYGESNNGMDRTPADLSERGILENHAPPFEAAIEADVLTMMVSGGDVNGMPIPASKRMLTDLLRDRLKFKGATMSDWEDVERLYSRHKIVPDRKEAVVRSFNAGLDMNMAVSHIGAVDVMEEAVKDGSIPMQRLDQAVRNILLVKFKLGLFEEQPLDIQHAGDLVGSRQSRALAEQLALESITLLKNENQILPLDRDTKSILITGSSADSKRHLCGGWTLGWAGAEEDDLECKTILDAIREKVPSATVTYVSDIDELREQDLAKKDFDVCISVVSEEPHAEWYGDSMELGFEEPEEALLRAAIATGIPVVVVSVIGRPLNVSWLDDQVAAMLWAYLPGTEGAQPVADILFGEHNPCGRLPISFPRDASHVPVVYNARNYESDEINTRYDPLYSFGYGLSYTDFTYSKLKVPAEVKSGEEVEVTITVSNAGKVDGSEVVQLFLRDIFASVTRPLKSLKAFARVSLKAGESKTVSLTLTPHQLSLYDEDLKFVEEARPVEALIGDQVGEFRILG